MKISQKTLTILENFAQINTSLIFNQEQIGKLSTKNEGGNIVAFYDLPDGEKEIPEFGIYDLPNLLSLISEFKSDKDFDIEFKDKKLLIKNKISRVNYWYSSIDLLTKAPKSIKKELPEADINFKLTPEHFKKLMKMTTILTFDTLKIECKENKIYGIVIDNNNPQSNSFKLFLGKNDKDFDGSVKFQTTDWKMITDYTYNVSIIKDNISVFKAVESVVKEDKTIDTEVGLTYYVAPLQEV